MKIKDLCDLQNGRAFKPDDWGKDGLPIIRIQNLNDANASFNYYSGKYNKIHEINDGDLLFSWSGTPGTSFGAFRWYRGKGILNQHIFKVVPKIEIDKEYLKYALNGKLNEIIAKAHGGVGLQHITKKELDNIDIPIVQLPKQLRIVKELSCIDNIISLRREQIRKLDLFIKARFIEMFEDKGFQKEPFINVCEELFAGGDVKKDRTVKSKDASHPFAVYTNGEKDAGLYGYTDIARVIKPSITISGRGTIGFTCVRTKPFYPAIRLIVAVPKDDVVTPYYLKLFIDSKDYSGRGASIPQLTIPMIKNELIPIPPIKKQKEFEEYITKINEIKNTIQKSVEYSQTLFDSLMQKYFG